MFVVTAELLVWRRFRSTSNPLRPQRGDIIAVKPPGWQWGRAEGPPDFAVVEVEDLTLRNLKFLPASEWVEVPASGMTTESVVSTIRAHSHKLDVDNALRVSTQQRSDFDSGRVTLTKSETQNAIRRTSDDGTVLSFSAQLSRSARGGLQTFKLRANRVLGRG